MQLLSQESKLSRIQEYTGKINAKTLEQISFDMLDIIIYYWI